MEALSWTPRIRGSYGYYCRLGGTRTVLSFLGSAEGVLFQSQLGNVATVLGWGAGPLHSPVHRVLKLFLQIVLSTTDGNGNKVKWSENLSRSHFSALGVIYQFIVEETIR